MNGDAAYYDYSVCDSLVFDEVCNLDITISFYCGGKKIELPPYTAQINVNKSGSLDYILFVFTEFDERNISGHACWNGVSNAPSDCLFSSCKSLPLDFC